VRAGETVIYPEEYVMDPETFITSVAKDKVTILEVVPSYLSVILDYIDAFGTLTLTLEYLLVTGETVKPGLVSKWFDKYPGIKVVNAYGPTEASDDITHHTMEKAPEQTRVPIGKPVQNFNIYIVDKNMNLCPPGIKGEIWVSGVGVGRGYLNDRERTEKAFIEDPFREEKGVRLYKTGDLGTWLPDGTVDFFGRLDFQVKIRGFRIELGDIETKLQENPAVKEAVVIDREDGQGNKYLCAYLVPAAGENLSIPSIKNYLGKRLPEYMVPAHFLQLEKIPLTPNGKTDRKALPQPNLSRKTTVKFITEEKLQRAKTTLENQEHQGYAIEKSGEFLDNLVENTSREWDLLREYTLKTEQEYHPLSYPQKMIYLIEKKHMGTGCNNIVFFVRYNEDVDAQILEEAVNKLVHKHGTFRLRMTEIEYGAGYIPAQYLTDYEEFTIESFDFSTEGSEPELQKWLETRGGEAFQFLEGKLFYFAYIKLPSGESGCYIKIHNIVSDGLTFHIIIKEIYKIYQALKAGKPVKIKPSSAYLDFITHEREYLKSPKAKEDMRYNLDQMLPSPGEVTLSAQPIKSDSANITAERTKLAIPAELRSKIHEYSQKARVSWYKIVVSALSVYINRVSSVNNFVIGSLINNRSNFKYIKTAGIFIHFLPIAIQINETMDFTEFVKTTGKTLDELIEKRQSYPFEILAGQLRENYGIDPGYFYNVNVIGYPDLEEVTMERPFAGYEEAPFSLYVNRYNKDIHGELEFEWIYRKGLFTETDIRGIHRSLENILADALDNPGKKIWEIELLSQGEKENLYDENARRAQSALPYKIDAQTLDNPLTYILSEKGKAQPPGVQGELCIGGEKISLLDMPGRENIGARFFSDPYIKGRLVYRTGQAAKRLPNGEIQHLGQIDDQLPLGGVRVDSGKIKEALLKHEEITEAELFVKKETGGRHGTTGEYGRSDRSLYGCIVSKKALDSQHLTEYLSEKLPPYMVPTSFIQVEKMPLTETGEVDLRVLEALEIDAGSARGHAGPENPLQEKLTEMWQEFLGIEKTKIGIDSNFFDLGGHSLKTMILVSRIHKEFSVKMTLEQVFKQPTIRGLAEFIETAGQYTFIPVEAVEKRDYYAASPAQVRLYFIQQFETEGTAYNMPRAITLTGELKIDKLQTSFVKLI
ncbi:MAG: AMP-binding protein, partial [bacterium]|nr:AMP-binding protein [bacterium]